MNASLCKLLTRNLTLLLNGLFQKKPKQGGWIRGGEGWGYGISRDIKEIACGISRGQLKTKWNFLGWPRKNNVEFPGVFAFGLGISQGFNTILWNIQGLSFLSGNFRSQVKKIKTSRGIFKKVYPQPPLFVFFLE